MSNSYAAAEWWVAINRLVTSIFLRAANVLVPPGWKRKKCSMLCFLPSCFTTNGVAADIVEGAWATVVMILTNSWSASNAIIETSSTVSGHCSIHEKSDTLVDIHANGETGLTANDSIDGSKTVDAHPFNENAETRPMEKVVGLVKIVNALCNDNRLRSWLVTFYLLSRDEPTDPPENVVNFFFFLLLLLLLSFAITWNPHRW